MHKILLAALCCSFVGNTPHVAQVIRQQNWVREEVGPWPLFVGNGRLGFSVDPSGSQLFKNRYPTSSLSLLAQDIWFHPDPPGDAIDRDLTLEQVPFRDRSIGYATKKQPGEEALFDQLRAFPTKPCLGTPRLGLTVEGESLSTPDQLEDYHQELDLWEATIKTHYRFRNVSSEILTYLHPKKNVLTFEVDDKGETDSLRSFTFELGSPAANLIGEEIPAEGSPVGYPFDLSTKGGADSSVWVFRPLPRRFGYAVGVVTTGARVDWEVSENALHGTWPSGKAPVTLHLAILPEHSSADVMKDMERLLTFLSETGAAKIRNDRREWWKGFWKRSFVDFSGSTDSICQELQSRWARDLYLIFANDAGPYPPAESGLVVNSWYGKFHLEMTFWHIAGLLSSNRADLVKEMLMWFPQVLDAARARAKDQGFEGARFPKMTSYNGQDSPSHVGQLILWHVGEIPLLCDRYYRATRDEEFRKNLYEVVTETADFCASYLTLDPEDGRYHLLPPIASCAENTDPRETKDPAYTLGSFKAALRIAVRWAEELGRDAEKCRRWQGFLDNLADPPYDGDVYLTCAGLNASYEKEYTGSGSHPGMLGLLFNTEAVPADERMNRTLDKVLASWNFDGIWGWDFGLCAANAAHLGRAEDAVNLLVSSAFANRRLPTGWNSRWPETRPVSDAVAYLPGSGGTLLALHEMLAHENDGVIQVFPGIPKTSGWTVAFNDITVQGGTRVSARMVGGKVESIELAGAGSDTVRLAIPEPGEEGRGPEGGEATKVLSVQLDAGKTWTWTRER